MADPWNEDVRGTQVPPLINDDRKTIVVEAGPGTGKTFGLVRRVQRILHPDGLGVAPDDVLVVAFNRVIAKSLRKDIAKRLKESGHSGKLPVISTIHALCGRAIGKDLRLLMDHEREPLLYDVFQQFPELKKDYDYHKAVKALRDHEAGIASHPQLSIAVERWLVRHKAALLSDLPQLLLDSLKSGDATEESYQHVIVDEFQDLTIGNQELFLRMIKADGSLVALGDPRQSIYAFLGNDRLGLRRLEDYRPEPLKLPMTECQRCPRDVVALANHLMSLSDAAPMDAVSGEKGDVSVVHWKTPAAEAKGMAAGIAANLTAHPNDRHLVMVTRRKFGFMLREELKKVRDDIDIEMNFSEGLLETWAAREAFLLFSLLADPDAPTWRAWFGYQNSESGKRFRAKDRNSAAYLRFLAECGDLINAQAVAALAAESPPRSRGAGTKCLHERARRFVQLKEAVRWDSFQDGQARIESVFDPQHWFTSSYEDSEIAKEDLAALASHCGVLLSDQETPESKEEYGLRAVVRDLRYLIATREPLRETRSDEDETDSSAEDPSPEAASDKTGPSLQIATLWGAKGVTADQVYILGLCEEAIPSERRDEYPGTAEDHFEEQRRLFYVSVTRTTKTLVLSRPKRIQPGQASKLGLTMTDNRNWADLHASPFLKRILPLVPDSLEGSEWLLSWPLNEASNASITTPESPLTS